MNDLSKLYYRRHLQSQQDRSGTEQLAGSVNQLAVGVGLIIRFAAWVFLVVYVIAFVTLSFDGMFVPVLEFTIFNGLWLGTVGFLVWFVFGS